MRGAGWAAGDDGPPALGPVEPVATLAASARGLARRPQPCAIASPSSAVAIETVWRAGQPHLHRVTAQMVRRTRALIAKIHELQVDPEVVLAHQRDGRLQTIAVLAGDPQLVVLDLRLDPQLAVLDGADDLLGGLLLDPLLDQDELPDRAAAGGLRGLLVQAALRHAAFGHALAQHRYRRVDVGLGG